ncbi:homoserine dehydrogenase [Methanobacterium alcaliphilum]|uniref:homoserine dehydrogenase n=1 Tax=Methanobacterium alcaliphilum TaxID=392018 RepID=UPI00200AB057|nr:homoserine dehydrogenase [Methanobacterium alcaliphilum]MCK9150663.1 homoserine dehydrogenase [Methanobacterium alcaliphilum]
MRICLMGFGAVGRGVAHVISQKNDYLKKNYGLELKLVAVTDSSGAVINEQGINTDLLLKTKSETGKVSDYPEYGVPHCDGMEVLDKLDYDCLIEVTPTNIEDGEPGKSLIIKAMKNNKDVVTSNKGHLALFFSEMMDLAGEKGVELKYEASVGGAMPIINFAHDTLSGCKINSILGILNGTTNFILSRMTREGSSYEQTLQEAQQLGIAETDPTQDVEGIDAACKSVILANSIMGLNYTLNDVEVEGISRITAEAIEIAKRDGYLIKLMAEISEDSLTVSPRLVREDSPYAVEGTLNMATLKTDLADEVTVVGRGAGSIETASAILSDIINIWRNKKV